MRLYKQNNNLIGWLKSISSPHKAGQLYTATIKRLWEAEEGDSKSTTTCMHYTRNGTTHLTSIYMLFITMKYMQCHDQVYTPLQSVTRVVTPQKGGCVSVFHKVRLWAQKRTETLKDITIQMTTTNTSSIIENVL